VTAPLSLLSGLCLDATGRPVDAVAAPVLTGLLQATLALYDELPVDGPCAAGLVSGAAPALDRGLDCAGGCAGQLWVRLVAVYPSRAFPDPDVGTIRPPVSWAVTAEVGLVRPAPTLHDAESGTVTLPTMAEETTAADLAAVDAAILREALLVRYARAQGVGIALGTWVPYGPEGGIVGGAWTASIQVP
jgi:hypothetical protein